MYLFREVKYQYVCSILFSKFYRCAIKLHFCFSCPSAGLKATMTDFENVKIKQEDFATDGMHKIGFLIFVRNKGVIFFWFSTSQVIQVEMSYLKRIGLGPASCATSLTQARPWCLVMDVKHGFITTVSILKLPRLVIGSARGWSVAKRMLLPLMTQIQVKH